MKKEILINAINEKITEVLNMGYNVLRRENSTYFHFSDGKRIGYCQIDDLSYAFNYSTVNKPHRDHGTGERVSDLSSALNQPTLRFGTGSMINYYENFDSFCNQYWDKSAEILRGVK